MFIFKLANSPEIKNEKAFMLLKKVNLREIPEFINVSMDFHFKKVGSTHNVKEVIMFTKKDCIFELNFVTLAVKITYVYRDPLEYQP